MQPALKIITAITLQFAASDAIDTFLRHKTPLGPIIGVIVGYTLLCQFFGRK